MASFAEYSVGGSWAVASPSSCLRRLTLRLWHSLLSCRVKPVQHQIDYNASHRDVQPDGERPPGNSHVLFKLFVPGTVDCYQRHWNDTRGQDNVGDQEGEVDWSDEASPLKGHGADAVVVDQVGDQKQRGHSKGRHHTGLVSRHLFQPNENISDAEKNCTCSIEKGVESGQGRDVAASLDLCLPPQQQERHTQDHKSRHNPNNQESQTVSHIVISIQGGPKRSS